MTKLHRRLAIWFHQLDFNGCFFDCLFAPDRLVVFVSLRQQLLLKVLERLRFLGEAVALGDYTSGLLSKFDHLVVVGNLLLLDFLQTLESQFFRW